MVTNIQKNLTFSFGKGKDEIMYHVEFQTILTGIVAFCAFFGLLTGVIKMFLMSIERDIQTLKNGQIALDVGQKEIKTDFNNLKNGQIALEAGQKEIKTDFNNLIKMLETRFKMEDKKLG